MLFRLLTIIITRSRNLLHKVARFFRFRKIRKVFRHKHFSVFSSNCVGCLMLHDLGVAFNSPFVNLFVEAKDYIKYLKNPQGYNQMDFVETPSVYNYPVGLLGDLTFHFVHYKTFEEAVSAFKRRAARISYENLFVIFSERDGCTYEDLKEFDALPYKNKVVFTHTSYKEILSSYYIEGFEDNGFLGNIIIWDQKLGSKIYDKFDFVTWFLTNKLPQNNDR